MPQTSLPPATQTIGILAAQPAVHRAFQWFHLQEPQLRSWQREIAAIAAPPFAESTRADWLCQRFLELGLQDVHIDACGNALAWLPAASVAAQPLREAVDRPCILLSAHLDTVFPAEAMHAPVEQDSILFAPSVCDNASGLTALLALAAALRAAKLLPEMDILFAGNVGEEGEGNLRGMRYLFTESPLRQRIAAALVLDGAGVDSIVTQGLGSRRFRISITGPGGHSWSDAGVPNPVLALAAALVAINQMPLPKEPRSAWNAGRIEGGSAINSIPDRADARIDLRSTDGDQLLRMEQVLRTSVAEAVAASNHAAGDPHPDLQLRFAIDCIGERPAASLPQDAPLLALVQAVDRHFGIHSAQRTASTDANIPLALGIPAVCLGSGGTGGGIHTREEWYDATGRDLGLRRILLLLLALAQPSS
jgi:tripeptide aminopeptidase